MHLVVTHGYQFSRNREKIRPFFSFFLILAINLGEAKAGFAGVPAVMPLKGVSQWNGEFFRKQEGALFVKTLASGFSGTALANVKITLFGIIQQQAYIFSNPQTEVTAPPRSIWKFGSGKYRVDVIEFTDQTGTKRFWRGDKNAPVVVVIPRLTLSNLGVWNLSPVGADKIAVKFSMIPNSYVETVPAKDSAVAAVVNGFTGTMQKAIGGKGLIANADNDYSTRSVLRSEATFARQIGMYYKVELFKHNMYAKDLLGSLTAFDLNLRGCYLKALEENYKLKGDIVFQILTSEKTGTIKKAKKARGSVTNGGLIDCLIGELQQIPMPVQETMVGELSFTFDVK